MLKRKWKLLFVKKRKLLFVKEKVKVVVCQRESEMFSKLRLEMNFVKIQGNNWTILVKYNVHIFKTEGKEQRERRILQKDNGVHTDERVSIYE